MTDLTGLGEKSIFVDCDVIQADGGTRTAAITGGFVALALALNKMKEKGLISRIPLSNYVAAVSVGLGGYGPLLDLNYEEDSSIDTDMNFVMTGKGEFVELQGTAEKQPFNSQQLIAMSELANKGCQELFAAQESVIGNFFKRS